MARPNGDTSNQMLYTPLREKSKNGGGGVFPRWTTSVLVSTTAPNNNASNSESYVNPNFF